MAPTRLPWSTTDLICGCVDIIVVSDRCSRRWRGVGRSFLFLCPRLGRGMMCRGWEEVWWSMTRQELRSNKCCALWPSCEKLTMCYLLQKNPFLQTTPPKCPRRLRQSVNVGTRLNLSRLSIEIHLSMDSVCFLWCSCLRWFDLDGEVVVELERCCRGRDLDLVEWRLERIQGMVFGWGRGWDIKPWGYGILTLSINIILVSARLCLDGADVLTFRH